MNDDFNTPVAVAEILAFSKISAKIISSNDINLAKQANNIVKMYEDVLGFDFKCDTIKKEADNDEKLVNLLNNVREKLRAEKNFALSDYVRDELGKLNINVSDKKIK